MSRFRLVRSAAQAHLTRAASRRFWNWVELFSPLTALLGLLFIEFGDPSTAAHLLAVSAVTVWLRLLQTMRGHKAIGPLIPVILRMLVEVLKFSVIMVIFLLAFAVGIYSLLRPDIGISFDAHGKVQMNDYMVAEARDTNWPEEYRTLQMTVKSLARAGLGDFNTDFTGAKYEYTAYAAYCVYLIVMMLLLMNLLITLLVSQLRSLAMLHGLPLGLLTDHTSVVCVADDQVR